MSRRSLPVVLAVCAGVALAQDAAHRRNWFNDPFFQVSDAIPDCPLPAGPFLTETERRAESHLRAEKGTTCWLAGECDRPSAYAYDRDIAAALQRTLAAHGPPGPSTLWVTVQGRVVYFEGCATRKSLAVELEALARAVPDVQQAVASIRTNPRARPPYKLRSAP